MSASTTLRWAGAAALLSLAACTTVVTPDATPSSSTSITPSATGRATDAPYLTARDLIGLIGPDDMSADLEMEEYGSFSLAGSYATDWLVPETIGAIEPIECIDLHLSGSLVRESDAETDSRDEIVWLYDVGGVGLAAETPSISVLARIFDDETAAEEFVDGVLAVATNPACAQGYSQTLDGEITWSADSIEINIATAGYPASMSVHELDFFNEGYSIPYAQVFVQYHNIVLTGLDISTGDATFVTPNDIHYLMRLMTQRLEEAA